MPIRDLESWMWAEACEMLDRAERLHRQFFRPAVVHAKRPAWEPPIDVYETKDTIVIIVALPGVMPEQASIIFENNQLVISGRRQLPVRAEEDIRRLEIPYGRFERCITFPGGHFELSAHEFMQGCLLVTLRKI